MQNKERWLGVPAASTANTNTNTNWSLITYRVTPHLTCLLCLPHNNCLGHSLVRILLHPAWLPSSSPAQPDCDQWDELCGWEEGGGGEGGEDAHPDNCTRLPHYSWLNFLMNQNLSVLSRSTGSTGQTNYWTAGRNCRKYWHSQITVSCWDTQRYNVQLSAGGPRCWHGLFTLNQNGEWGTGGGGQRQLAGICSQQPQIMVRYHPLCIFLPSVLITPRPAEALNTRCWPRHSRPGDWRWLTIVFLSVSLPAVINSRIFVLTDNYCFCWFRLHCS